MDQPLKRITLSLPINKNTCCYVDELLSLIRNSFGGCTFSKYHYPPLKINNEEVKGYFLGKFGDYPDEEVCYIIFDVNPIEFPNVYEDTTKIIKQIEKTGEHVVWLTYHDIKLCK